MLKALELLGFKSFADETRFEFPPGITVVVGPNGSGKSNIVDAMKWVLGEQSARSLRGKEMADVIFKGSGSGNRRPSNTAEATIVFDNSTQLFGVDTPEVRVTRRVYRSGEGEYLINGQACRLRDIKDMFRGTGVGTDAYSLIEQGKVDSLLQASTKDRRAIFEEAAGISRFKAKKIESQRRLDRVEQNLLRLSDIVEEVESRLRRLKAQAGKARRYREYAERLQTLRTQVGRVDWEAMTEQLLRAEEEFRATSEDLEVHQSDLTEAEARAHDLEAEETVYEEAVREVESHSAGNRERSAELRATVGHQRSRMHDLEDELARFRRQWLAMTGRAGDLQSQWKSVATQLQEAAEDHQGKLAIVQSKQTGLDAATVELDEARRESESHRSEYLDGMRQASNLTQQIATLQSRLEAAEATRDRSSERLDELQFSLDQAKDEAAFLVERRDQLDSEAEEHDAERKEARRRIKKLNGEIRGVEAARATLSERLAAVGERLTVLEEIDERMEGVGTGVKQLLAMAGRDASGPLSGIRGMVADLIQIPHREDAAMVAAALGDRAQHLVIAGTKLIDLLADGRLELPGRVGFVRLQSAPPPKFLRDVDLEGQQGVIGRADRLVRTETEYEHLIDWLLGDTWLVESLKDAVQFHRSLAVPPRLVTRTGEVLDRDGRLTMGPVQAELQLIPRRVELESLREMLGEISEQRKARDGEVVSLGRDLSQWEARMEEVSGRTDAVHRELAEAKLKSEAAQSRLKSLVEQQQALHAEQQEAELQSTRYASELESLQSGLSDVQESTQALEDRMRGFTERIAELESKQKEANQSLTSARVVLAKSEQNLEALQARSDQLQRDQAERARALSEVQKQIKRTEVRMGRTQLDVLRADAELAELSILEEVSLTEIKSQVALRDNLRAERRACGRRLESIRESMRKLEQRRHTKEMETERLRRERSLLAERLQEDYGIDVARLQADSISSEEMEERECVDSEIGDLRRKISNLGSVNMDALDELNDLETRYESLASQYQDLVNAKESLEKIIQRINSDSRRLFTETLEAIRTNFQVLFRKVFGGGSADIVLEPDVDILEAGIDVIATPPGKHSLGLSLLSGGERALTAVTLLMAIFQYRPSPFCVLDEVDGPLDEANIGRFIEVLREFLEWTKFVVVTHSKKTMTAAHTLYGVTMQESGVSKRVSVRFEDVSEDGHIAQSAVEREDQPDSTDEAGRGVA